MIQQSTKAAVVVFHSARKQELAKKLARLWTKWLQLRLHSNVVSLLLNIKSLRVNTEHSHGLQQLYYTLRNKSELYCLHWLYGAGSSIRAAVCLLHTFVFIRGWVIFIFEFTLIIIFWFSIGGSWRPPGSGMKHKGISQSYISEFRKKVNEFLCEMKMNSC